MGGLTLALNFSEIKTGADEHVAVVDYNSKYPHIFTKVIPLSYKQSVEINKTLKPRDAQRVIKTNLYHVVGFKFDK